MAPKTASEQDLHELMNRGLIEREGTRVRLTYDGLRYLETVGK